jgi:chromosome partitioning protein
MRIIALFNQKGGVGKTTSTANLGAALAQSGKRVVLVDLDPQANLTTHLGIDPSGDHPSTYRVLADGVPLKESLQKVADRLQLAPSATDLAAAEVELVGVVGRELLLRKMAEAQAITADYVLIDCPPSLGLLTLNALSWANEVIIPLQAHYLSLQGMAKLFETCALVRRQLNPKLKISGILFCQFEAATKLSSEVRGEVDAFLTSARGTNEPWSEAIIFTTFIRRNIKLAEAPSFGQSIFLYAPGSAGAADYAVLAQEVMMMKV